MPDYETQLRAQAISLGLADKLMFLGDRSDVPDLLMAMDIFVWLSRGEGMPHVIAEAGAAGLPVIATADNGAIEQIIDGQTGIFVPYEDPNAVALAIDNLIHHPDVRSRLGKALRDHVARTYATDVVARQWQALFYEVLQEIPAKPAKLFKSFVQGGFECSTHRLRSGKRTDVIAATGHDAHAASDYKQLSDHGLLTVRDGLRWHIIETTPNHYDFSSFHSLLQAAQTTGMQVIYDLMHYGWPDDIDIWTPDFIDRFTSFARAAAQVRKDMTDAVPFWCPINDISFFAWAGGDAQYLNPFATGRGFELKAQLARASISAMHALRDIDPRARFVHCEPLIAIHHDAGTGLPRRDAEGWHQAQFQAFELVSGRLWPQIGGDPTFLDIVGLNYYPRNQWVHGGPPIDIGHPLYRPLSDLLFENYARYHRPILIAETGIEGDRRPDWFTYVAAEVARARARGVEVEGICLYPITNHLGWDDDRHCQNGLLGHQVIAGQREVYAPLAQAIEAVVAQVSPSTNSVSGHASVAGDV